MRIRNDGSIQSGNTPTPGNLGYISDTRLYRGMVVARHFVGAENLTKNAQNPRVLYDVVILGGQKSGQLLTQCRVASSLGGNNNYHEIVLQPSSKVLNEVPLADHDGDIIFLQFVQGDRNYGIIIACDNGLKTSGDIGASLSDGVREIRQFNGFRVETTKTGEYILTRQGGTEVEGSFQPLEGAPEYKLEYRAQEKVIETFKSGLSTLKDGTADVITETLSGGLTITKDGASDSVIVTTSAGVVATFDGSSNNISLTAGATILTIDGATGKISLSGAFVDLGTAVSDLSVLFTQLAASFSTHIHLHTSIPGTTPTSPPVAPLPASVASSTVKLQA